MELRAEIIRTGEVDLNLPRTTAKRFWFTSDHDVLDLKVIQLSCAFITNYGKTTKLFEHAIDTFINQKSVIKKKEKTMPGHSTWKALQNRFKAMMAEHRSISLEAKEVSAVEVINTNKEQP